MNDSIIDWELSTQLAGNNIEYAKEYLNLLANDLSKQLEIIRKNLEKNNLAEIKKNLHYILGALSYCGATQLKSATVDLNNALKNNTTITDVLIRFETETNLLIEYVNSHSHKNPL